MAIANIRSNLWRRAAIVASIPALPIAALIAGCITFAEEVRSWPGLVADVWRAPI